VLVAPPVPGAHQAVSAPVGTVMACSAVPAGRAEVVACSLPHRAVLALRPEILGAPDQLGGCRAAHALRRPVPVAVLAWPMCLLVTDGGCSVEPVVVGAGRLAERRLAGVLARLDAPVVEVRGRRAVYWVGPPGPAVAVAAAAARSSALPSAPTPHAPAAASRACGLAGVVGVRPPRHAGRRHAVLRRAPRARGAGPACFNGRPSRPHRLRTSRSRAPPSGSGRA
jgi:hypothetical protein